MYILNFLPAQAAERHVTITLSSNCSDMEAATEADTVVCRKVKTTQRFQFTATVEVDKGICDVLPPSEVVSFDLKIFGQSESTLRVDLSIDLIHCP